MKNINFIFDVNDVTKNGQPPALLTRKWAYDAATADTTTRGYTIDNLTISGSLRNYNTGTPALTLFNSTSIPGAIGTWAGETVRNVKLHDLYIGGINSAVTIDATDLTSMMLENVNSPSTVPWTVTDPNGVVRPTNVSVTGITDRQAVSPSTAPVNQWANGLSNRGVIAYAQINFSNLAGSLACSQTPALTGDITKSSGSCATTLATVNSNVGTFGDGTHVGQVTVNAKGQVTAASSVAITGAAPTGAAGGDLAGTYPNPTITNAPVITKVLTGFASGAGTVGAADSILSALQKIDGNGALKAPLASPALTGTPTAPTAAVDTNTTQIATTAMVLGQAASATPLIDGVAAVGTSTRYARADHVHPTDTSRQAALTAGQLPGTATNDNASAGNVGEIRQCNARNFSAVATITIASPGVITWTAHGLSTDGLSPVNFTTTGALPTGLVAGTVYWTVPGTVTTDTFQLATSIANAIAGTAINTSGSQSGTHLVFSTFAPTTATNVNYCALNLPAGDWDVTGTLGLTHEATTNIAYIAASISTTSATHDQTPGRAMILAYGSGTVPGHAASQQFVLPTTRLSLSAPTVVYAVSQVSFTVSALTVYGSVWARRAR
jgi:hypothetical protein